MLDPAHTGLGDLISSNFASQFFFFFSCLNNTDVFFFTVLEAGSPRSRCQKGWFLLRLLFLACTLHMFVPLCPKSQFLKIKLYKLRTR